TMNDDEKRGRGWKEFENFLRGGKIVALLAPRSRIPISQLGIRFIDIFSQSFERFYLLLYNIVYLAFVHRCCTRDYPPCFEPHRTLVDQIGGG
ncbi:hypothetical protein ALC62_00600, partial [Cyphomyrmex costatus]